MKRRIAVQMILGLAVAGLYSWALTQDSECRVRLSLVDERTRQPVPGVVRFLPQEGGAPLSVSSLLGRGQGIEDKAAIHDWHGVPESLEIALPRKAIRVEAFSGTESETAAINIDLTGKSSEEVNIPLKFFSQISQDGWYAGNTHLHLSKLSKEQAEHYLHVVPRADRLDILFISYLERNVADKDYITNRYPIGDLKEFWSSGVLVNNGEEHRHNFEPFGEGFGHVMFLNIRELVRPVSLGKGITGKGNDDTPLQRGIEEAHRQGGVAIWCHNNWGLEDVPHLVAGRLDGVNIFDGGDHGSYEESFYHYLNAGLRVPFSTGTDWFMYDLARVYTKVEGRLGIRSWLDALVAGRTFISNGPLFEFQVDGKEIGSTVNLTTAGQVQVKGRAIGRVPFGKLQLVQNGQVRKELSAASKHGYFEATVEEKLLIAEPGWLALRISNGEKNEYGRALFGHTSPVYITINGRAIRMQGEVDYLVQQMEEAQKTIQQKAVFTTQQERQRVLSVYERGIAMLRNQ